MSIAVVIVRWLLAAGYGLAFATGRARNSPPGAAPSGAQPAPGTVNGKGWEAHSPGGGQEGQTPPSLSRRPHPAVLEPPTEERQPPFWAPAEGRPGELDTHAPS